MDNEDQNARPEKQILTCLTIVWVLIGVWLVIGIIIYVVWEAVNGQAA
jgi:heme/copper-type cytochrome/quinol oxidase subunit 2